MLWIFDLCLWSDHDEVIVRVIVFNLWLVQVLFLCLVVKFLMFQWPFACYYLWTRSVLRGISQQVTVSVVPMDKTA